MLVLHRSTAGKNERLAANQRPEVEDIRGHVFSTIVGTGAAQTDGKGVDGNCSC